ADGPSGRDRTTAGHPLGVDVLVAGGRRDVGAEKAAGTVGNDPAFKDIAELVARAVCDHDAGIRPPWRTRAIRHQVLGIDVVSPRASVRPGDEQPTLAIRTRLGGFLGAGCTAHRNSVER